MKCVAPYFGTSLFGKLPRCMIHHDFLIVESTHVHSSLNTQGHTQKTKSPMLQRLGNSPYSIFYCHDIEYTMYNVQSLTRHAYLLPVLMLVIIDNVISFLCCYVVSSPAISHACLSPLDIQYHIALFIRLDLSSYDSILLHMYRLSC